MRQEFQQLKIFAWKRPLGPEEVAGLGEALHGRHRHWACERAQCNLHGSTAPLDYDKAVRVRTLYNFPSSQALPGPLQRAHHRPHQRLLRRRVARKDSLGTPPSARPSRGLAGQVLLQEPQLPSHEAANL